MFLMCGIHEVRIRNVCLDSVTKESLIKYSSNVRPGRIIRENVCLNVVHKELFATSARSEISAQLSVMENKYEVESVGFQNAKKNLHEKF